MRATYAPSVHNTQPWKIRPRSDAEADLYYDPRRLLPVEDREYRFLFVAMGIFCESLKVVAKARGWDVDVHYLTDQ